MPLKSLFIFDKDFVLDNRPKIHIPSVQLKSNLYTSMARLFTIDPNS